MNSPENSSYAQPNQHDRTDLQWLSALRDQAGTAAQREAFRDLGSYLHVVAYNYLKRCRANSVTLTYLENSELGTLAEDHVHTFMEKLVKNNFALLEKYHQQGRFTAWAAAVLTNLMATDMRKAAWRKQVPYATNVSTQQADEWSLQPDVVAMQNSILLILQNGIEDLPRRYQIALTRCLLEGEAAKEVAKSLEITPNAVNMLVHRAKKNMRKYLIAHDVDQSVIGLFA